VGVLAFPADGIAFQYLLNLAFLVPGTGALEHVRIIGAVAGRAPPPPRMIKTVDGGVSIQFTP
jgi:hypothetical protein